MGIFGRSTRPRRLGRPARRSPPPFAVPADCTAWLVGGVWPAELSEPTAETATLAAHLRADLRRIAESANERLGRLDRADVIGSIRVVEDARQLATHRVDAAVRQVPNRPPTPGPRRGDGTRRCDDGPESGHHRLRRLLAVVARQQPELRWAVGDRADGATILVTDLAHGWIPAGIAVPAGVRLLTPQRRGTRLAELLGPTTRSATYAPADRFAWPPESAATESSSRPRELPVVDDLAALLADAAHRRDALPPLVGAVATAGMHEAETVDAELDLLRVRLDTTRYRLLPQYPQLDEPSLLDWLLLAATVGLASGDMVAANYHFAWFRALAAGSPAGNPAGRHAAPAAWSTAVISGSPTPPGA